MYIFALLTRLFFNAHTAHSDVGGTSSVSLYTHLLALFLQIYQQVWKFENEDVKIINIFLNYAKTICKLLYLSADQLGKKFTARPNYFFDIPI
jgi:hypothetical protein